MNTSISTTYPWVLQCRDALSGVLHRVFAAAAPRATALHELDAHTLRDIGIDASEFTSIMAESCREAELSRLRIVVGLHHG